MRAVDVGLAGGEREEVAQLGLAADGVDGEETERPGADHGHQGVKAMQRARRRSINTCTGTAKMTVLEEAANLGGTLIDG